MDLQFQYNSSKMFCLAAGILGLFLVSAPLAAQGNSQGQANAQAIRNWNTRVLQLHGQLLNANANFRASIQAEAAPVFQQRAAALAKLAETDPQAVLDTAFSADLLQELGADFPGAELEQQGEFSGLVEHIVLDDETLTRGQSDIRIQVRSEWVKVTFAGETPDVACNDILRVRGVKIGDAVAAADGVTSGSGGTISTCSTTGTQYIAVLLVTFPGVAPPAGVTATSMQSAFFGTTGRSVDNFWKEASQGKTSATGKVFGWFTLDAAYSCSDYFKMRDAAIRAADSSVDFRTFNRVMLVFPKPTGCTWAGLGTLGCSTLTSPNDGTFTASVSWLIADHITNLDNAVKLATHEGGHNLGLHHARTFDYGSLALGAIGSTGTVSEYGDNFSTMGSWNFGHYSASNKVRLGWFSASASAPTIETTGVYDVAPFGQTTPGLQALKIRRGTGNNAWLWLEYRKPLGLFESALSTQVYSGATIRYEEGTTSYSNLLDHTPETSGWTDPALVAGRTWTDPYSNVSIQVLSATSAALSVAVNYGATPCVYSTPTVSVSPSNPSGLAGSNLTYTVTVTNRDSSGCSPATFLPGSTAPTGWTTSYSTSGLTVNPGAADSFDMTKTIPAGTAAATYAVNVSVSDANHSQSASASATVTTATCTRAQPTLTLSPSSLSGLPGASLVYTVSVLNNDSSACTASTFAPASTVPSGWANVFSSAGLALNPGASGSFTMTKTIPAGTAAATYTVNASVTTPNHSRSASGSAVVTSSTRSLTATLTGPTSTVKIRTNVTLTALVLSGGNPAANATVTFVITMPGQTSTKTVQTNSQGIAKETFKSVKAGSYSAEATAVLGSQSATTNTVTFVAQ